MTASPVIEINNLRFSYNGKPVLKDVALTVPPNDFLAMIGPNGGGKTTLLKLILGLLKPDCGTLRVFGKKPGRVVHRIGYVPQFVHINLGFPITVAEVVRMGRLRTGRGWSSYHKKSDRRDAEAALDKMGMLSYRDHKMAALSGGQRQRVIVARALVTDPDLLILDEPTANLDAGGQTDLYNLLEECNRDTTILVATHDLMAMSSFVKSVACINRTLLHHEGMAVTHDMLEMAYPCPVELVAHGVPHRVLCLHDEGQGAEDGSQRSKAGGRGAEDGRGMTAEAKKSGREEERKRRSAAQGWKGR